jgi:hypothetical protein
MRLLTEREWFERGYVISPEQEAVHLDRWGTPMYRYDQVEVDFTDLDEYDDPGDDDYWMDKDE